MKYDHKKELRNKSIIAEMAASRLVKTGQIDEEQVNEFLGKAAAGIKNWAGKQIQDYKDGSDPARVADKQTIDAMVKKWNNLAQNQIDGAGGGVVDLSTALTSFLKQAAPTSQVQIPQGITTAQQGAALVSQAISQHLGNYKAGIKGQEPAATGGQAAGGTASTPTSAAASPAAAPAGGATGNNVYKQIQALAKTLTNKQQLDALVKQLTAQSAAMPKAKASPGASAMGSMAKNLSAAGAKTPASTPASTTTAEPESTPVANTAPALPAAAAPARLAAPAPTAAQQPAQLGAPAKAATKRFQPADDVTDVVAKTPNAATTAATPPQLGAPAASAPTQSFAQKANAGYGNTAYNAQTATTPAMPPKQMAPKAAPAQPADKAKQAALAAQAARKAQRAADVAGATPDQNLQAAYLQQSKENKKPSIAEQRQLKKLQAKLVVKEMALRKAKRDKGII